jgi:hypothetical protein
MALDRTFLAMTPNRLASAIMQARRRVVYAAPSLSLDVAAALVNVHERLDADSVAVVVDVSEGVFRLGYGVADALATLKDKRIAIRHAEGLRIAFVVIDDEGFIFAVPPLLVEKIKGTNDQPNAVRATKDQIEQLVGAVLPSPTRSSTSTSPEATNVPALQRAEIGQVVVPPAQIEKIEEAIKANPVDNFDLSRVVNVFSTHFQFYEFEVVGTRVETRTVQLPKSCSDQSATRRCATASPLPLRCCRRGARSPVNRSTMRRQRSGKDLFDTTPHTAESFSRPAVPRWTLESRRYRT